MFSKRFLPLVVFLGSVGLTGCASQGEELSQELTQLVQGLAIDQVDFDERRECPKEWDWTLFGPEARHGMGVDLFLPAGQERLSGPDEIQNVPEFHDCQRFLIRVGNEYRYDGLFAIFAVKSTIDQMRDHLNGLAEAMVGGHQPSPLPSLYDGFPDSGLPAAEIVAWAPYGRLGIEPGFNCLYLIRESIGPGAVWEAWMMNHGGEEKDCSDPVRKDSLRAHGRHLPVSWDMSGLAGEPNGITDFPTVARWVWHPHPAGRYSIGIWCDVGWCMVGNPGPRLKSFAERPPHPDGLSPEKRRVYEVKGWHDEQILADKAPGQPYTPTDLVGTVIPHPDLGTFDSTTFSVGDWIQTAEVALTNRSFQEESGLANPYKRKLNLDPAAAGRRLNQVSLCRGEWDRCRDGEPAAPVTAPACIEEQTDPWWARIVSAVQQDAAYYCVKRCEPEVDFIPGTARWRWSARDEGMWMRCMNGCCEITPW